MKMDLKEFIRFTEKTRKIRDENFGRKIHFYAPSFMYYKTKYFCSSPHFFPSISITGEACALKCKHCDGRVLKTMYPATSPEKLLNLCAKLKRNGAIGCLISGGCLPNGSVPFEKFVNSIAQVKEKYGLRIIIHTGLISYELAKKLKEAGVGSALLDVIGDNETIREIYNLDASVEDFENALAALEKAEIPTIPHVLVGLHYGKLKGELKALKMILKYKPAAVIVIAFIPIPKTPMETVDPPSPLEIAKVIAAARMLFPSIPIALGCMRPKGEHRIKTDELAFMAGVNAIAFPTEATIELAKNMGYETIFSSLCCSEVYMEFQSRKPSY